MKYSIAILSLFAFPALANVEITGSVEAKCVIQTTKAGSYGNPIASKLSTTPADGGVLPVMRYDVSIADAYIASITHPTTFSSSPSLTDTIAWTGSTSVTQTSVAGMSAYEAAKTVVRSRARALGIADEAFEKKDIHIHFPDGATPKDGPSAGITMLTAIASALTQRKVKSKLAMTGEITLRGKVLPVGGIKEKILAAKRAGIKEIIMCSKNRKDVEEIEAHYISDLSFHYVDDAKEVLVLALLKEQVKNPVKFVFQAVILLLNFQLL